MNCHSAWVTEDVGEMMSEDLHLETLVATRERKGRCFSHVEQKLPCYLHPAKASGVSLSSEGASLALRSLVSNSHAPSSKLRDPDR